MTSSAIASHKTWITRRGGLGLSPDDYAVLATTFGFTTVEDFVTFATTQQAQHDWRTANGQP